METPQPNKNGLASRVTNGGLFVCKLHYTADGYKNPENPEGKKWLIQALSGYAGGLQDPDWLKEMEIMYTAGSGQRVLIDWQNWLRSSNIFIDGDVSLTDAKIYGSYDHGYANPACYLVHAIFPEVNGVSLKKTIWEFYASEVPVSKIAEIIRGIDVTLDDGRAFDGNPYAGMESMKIADPEIDRRTQAMHNGPNKSIARLFKDNGVHFVMGERGDDITVANWLTGNLWVDPMNPGYQIHRACKNLIWELGKLQRSPQTSLQARTKNQPETLMDKDNHAWDALKYWMKRFPVGAPKKVEKKKEADFAFWRDRHKSKVKMSYLREFAK